MSYQSIGAEALNFACHWAQLTHSSLVYGAAACWVVILLAPKFVGTGVGAGPCCSSSLEAGFIYHCFFIWLVVFVAIDWAIQKFIFTGVIFIVVVIGFHVVSLVTHFTVPIFPLHITWQYSCGCLRVDTQYTSPEWSFAYPTIMHFLLLATIFVLILVQIVRCPIQPN